MKIVGLFLVAYLMPLVLGKCYPNSYHNLMVGYKCGWLMWDMPYTQPAQPSGAMNALHQFPQNGGNFLDPIGCYKIIDRMGPGDGGCVTEVLGGVGYSYLRVRFESQPKKAMSYSVQIYSKNP